MSQVLANINIITWSQAISGDDANDLSGGTCRGLLVDEAGDVKVSYDNGQTDTVYLAAGIWHGMRVARVWASGTTASGLHAGY